MRRQITIVMCSVVIGLTTVCSQAVAQQKTAKACAEEWRANKAANQANGITEKAYVATCRSGAAPSQSTAAPTASPSFAPPPTSSAPQTSTGQKTAKACAEEWRANKAANQANGVTEKAYVASCRGGAVPSQAGIAPAAPPPPAPAPTAATPQGNVGTKTVKACRDEWRANKAANQASGVTEGAYVAQCRGGAAPSQTTAVPAPAPTAAPAAPAPTADTPPSKPFSPAPSNPRPAPTAAGNPSGPNEFTTEEQAKARCPGGIVVWANLRSKIYHYSGYKNYGTTEHGAYMCESDTGPVGIRPPKNERQP
jgi:hypothetical protein